MIENVYMLGIIDKTVNLIDRSLSVNLFQVEMVLTIDRLGLEIQATIVTSYLKIIECSWLFNVVKH
jgi:hypothetical protein